MGLPSKISSNVHQKTNNKDACICFILNSQKLKIQLSVNSSLENELYTAMKKKVLLLQTALWNIKYVYLYKVQENR